MNSESTTDLPLVSIVVITYNSSAYVIETLESAKNQSYKNLELIVSDDCSTDSTIDICGEWIKNNKSRFVRTKIINVPSNTGIPANCNRGIHKSQGKWIKLIAGDDILMDNCITNAIEFSVHNPECKIFASNIMFFTDDIKANINKVSHLENSEFFSLKTDSKKQFEILAYNNEIHAPSVFLSKQLFLDQQGFDETIPYMEDYPFWLKITHSGHKIMFMNKVTVGYRLSTGSFSGYSDDKLFNNFFRNSFRFKKKNTFKYLSFIKRFDLTYTYLVRELFYRLNINNLKYKRLYQLLLRINIFR
jgi:glycosyltransferase involved in cell wall biosynthesis